MTGRAVADRSRDYMALMRCGAGDAWFPAAVAQIRSWLQEKGYDVDLDDAVDESQSGSRLTTRSLSNHHGNDLAVSLVEENSGTQWTTEFLIHDEHGDRDWISFVVRSADGRFVNVPRLARYLTQVLPLSDGELDFSDEPPVFGEYDVDRLIEMIMDDQRHGLLFVAGTDTSLPFDLYRARVNTWSREICGLAQMVVLDPNGTQALADRIGPYLAASAWTIRSYQPGANTTDPWDARRHRMIGTARLGTMSDGRLRYLLGDIARQQAASRPPDPAVQKLRRRFERFENSRLLEQVTARPAATIAPETRPLAPDATDSNTSTNDGALLDLVRRMLGLDQITEDSLLEFRANQVERSALQALEARVTKLQAENENLEDKLLTKEEEFLDALDVAQSDVELARLDLDQRDSTVAWLQARLKERNDYEAEYLDVPSEFVKSRPGDFDEFITRVEELDSVCFSGDTSEVAKLSQVDTNDAALRSAWDAVLTLIDYARARAEGACEHGLEHYLKHPPAGYFVIPSRKFGASETSATMKAFGSERIFPVPTSVHPSGRIEMKAHFKLARIGMSSPRMYVLDCHPAEPRVYIGYLGTHLTNTHTR